MAAIHAANSRELTSAFLMQLACLARACLVHVDPLPASAPTFQHGQEVERVVRQRHGGLWSVLGEHQQLSMSSHSVTIRAY